ncbi:MAG: apolipoprotein N-acyltransferase [bacterium]|nr:apolipoprotein N-acyltransferase [bacterium]
MRRWGFLLAAVIGALAFPPVSLWPLAYVALIPFLWAATDPARDRVFGPAWRAGLLFYGGVLYWVGLNSGAPWWASAIAGLALIAVLATTWGMTAWVVQRTARAINFRAAALIFVAAYQAIDIFWGTGEMSFPWATWALPLTASVPALQLAEVVDAQGLSFLVLIVNALLFLAWQTRRRPYALIGAALIVLPLLWGAWRSTQFDGGARTLEVAAVQANIPAELKWDMSSAEILDRHVALSDSIARISTLDFLCWPETAVPMPIRFRQWAADSLRMLSERTNSVILTGGTDYDVLADGEQVPYNAAFVVRPDTHGFQRSSKIHLVPFGERIPGQNWFPFLGNLHLGQAEFKPGDSVVVFSGGVIPPFTCLICFEVVYPDIAADAVLNGAQFFGHVTNDGWYGHSSGPYQHLALARLRAVAMRRAVVRSANTGISAIILPSGRYADRLGYDRTGVVSGAIPMRTDITVAARLATFWPTFYYGILALVIAALWMHVQRYGAPESS